MLYTEKHGLGHVRTVNTGGLRMREGTAALLVHVTDGAD